MIEEGPNEEKEVKKGHRAKRRTKNKGFSNYVIKTTLNSSFVKNLTDNEKKLLKHNLTLRSIEMSKGLQRLSFAVNILLLDCLENNKNIPIFLSKNVEIENIGTTFLKQILDPRSLRKPDERVNNFLNDYEHILPRSQTRFEGDRNTIVDSINMYITNFKTYLETTYEKNQKYYIKIWTETNDLKDYKSVIFSLINYNSHAYFKKYVPNEKVSEFVKYNRELLGFKENETIGYSKIFISNNYENIIKYNYIISQYLISNGHSGLLIAPICNIKRSYIHIDKDVF